MYGTPSNYWRDFFSAMEGSWKKLKTSNVFPLITVCYKRNRSALLSELLSNYSLFVGQLNEDKSLVLHALQMTSKQGIITLTTIHC